MGFGLRFAFTVGFGGALLLFGGVHLILDDDFAFDTTRELKSLFLLCKWFVLHALEVLVVLGFLREVVL